MTLPTFIQSNFTELSGQPLSDVARRARECGVNSNPRQIRDAWTAEYYRRHPDFAPAPSKRHGRSEE